MPFVIGCQTVVCSPLLRLRQIPGHLRGDIFWHVSSMEAALASSQNCSCPGGLPFQPLSLRICSFHNQNRFIMYSYFARRKSSGLDLLYLTIPSLSLVSSCRSLVRAFALIDISVSSTHKPIDKTTEYHHLPPVATLHNKRSG